MTITNSEQEPLVIHAEDGSWLAVSPEGASLHIGALAATREDAVSAFHRSVRMTEEAITGT